MKSPYSEDALRDERCYINELEYKVNMLTTFIDSSDAGMYVTDYHTGEILYANRKMASLGGYRYSAQELIGKTCWEAINPESKGRCPYCPHEKLVDNDEKPLTPYIWEHSFEEYGLWLKIISQAIVWTDGRLAQMTTFYDITETKKMQEELAVLEREKEHRRMQENLQAVLDLLPIPVRIIDLETSSILYVNKAALELFGIEKPEEAIGVSAFDFMPEMQPGGIRTISNANSAYGDKPATAEFVCVKPSGERLNMLVSACVIDYNAKRASLGVMKDLTSEKEYQRMQQSLQEILDKMPIPVRITNQESAEIVYVNNACLKLFECTSVEHMIGRRLTDMLPAHQEDGTDSNVKIDKLLRSEESLTMEMEYLTFTGKSIDARVTVCATDFEGRKSALAIIKDLAAEKEQKRLLLNAAQKEKEANRLKSSFLSNMSHEIRTPMNAIIGLTEIELHKNPPKKAMDIYKKINISARSLLEIVNDILDLSKIEADKLELFPDEFELEDVLNSALLVVSPRLEGKPVELMLNLSLDLPRVLIGDRTRLWQILKNYLDNAAKYTREGCIVLDVAEDKARSTEQEIFVSFTVTDTGIGMDEAQLQKALLPYEQVYSEAQKRYAGTGLGLPISKRLCELMGGVLDIRSGVGQGTLIRITVPFLRVLGSGSEKRTLESLSGLRVLAVDNDMLSLEIMGALLESGGADYVTARSGEEALSIILDGREKHPPFDIILLDYIMEGINGLETAKQIHGGASESSKLLMVTAYESLLIKDELQECGIDDVIEKPFVPSLFIQKIRAAAGYEKDAPKEQAKAYAQFCNARVLVCEDNEINQEVAVGMLEQFGIAPILADNGSRGVEILNSGEPVDLILMDLHMPVMNGYEATRAIRSDHRFDKIPIISLTADAMTEVIDKCLATGMNDYLPKPIAMDDLEKIFHKWLPEDKLTT